MSAAGGRSLGAGTLSNVYVNGTTGDDGYDGSSPTVLGSGVGPKSTIQAGIDEAVAYGTVYVAAGVYTENLDIDKGIYMEGADTRTTIIDGGNSGTVITVSASNVDVDIAYFTIRNGDGLYAGGIDNGYDCTLYLAYCAIVNNTGDYAGGICNEEGLLFVGGCLIAGNTTYTMGGGVLCLDSVFIIEGSTISGNAVGAGGLGGGGLCLLDSLGYIIDVTLAYNSAVADAYAAGGGLAVGASDVLIYNTIVAHNRASSPGTNNAFIGTGNLIAELYNIDSENSCGFVDPTDQVNAGPGLGPLQNNGGPTDTHAITVDSPAFDRGGPIFFADIDQRDVPRPQGAANDVGAFELVLSTGGSVNAAGGTGPELIYFTCNTGGIAHLAALPPNACSSALPQGMILPYGLFSFRIYGITPGATVRVTIKFPRVIPATAKYYKCSGTGTWIDCTSFVTHNPGDNFIVLTLTDGGPGDMDGLANGRITDPGGPAWSINAPPQSHSAYIAPPQQPVSLPALSVRQASLSAKAVRPGEPVTVSATVSNSGSANGAMKLSLTVNGKEEAVQGVTVNSGSTSPVSFTVSRNDPGTYSVYAGGTYAGEFTVAGAVDPDVILFISLAMICFAFILGAVMLYRRRMQIY